MHSRIASHAIEISSVHSLRMKYDSYMITQLQSSQVDQYCKTPIRIIDCTSWGAGRGGGVTLNFILTSEKNICIANFI